MPPYYNIIHTSLGFHTNYVVLLKASEFQLINIGAITARQTFQIKKQGNSPLLYSRFQVHIYNVIKYL
jgi:hypothetical protein